MPMPVSDDRLLPNRAGGARRRSRSASSIFRSSAAVGEPAAPGQRAAATPSASASSIFPPIPTMGARLQHARRGGAGGDRRAPGGMGFGEVDLGGGASDAVRSWGRRRRRAQARCSRRRRSIGGASAPRRRRATGARSRADRPPSKAPKILGLVVALLVVGGAALQFTPRRRVRIRLHQRQAPLGRLREGRARAQRDGARKKLARRHVRRRRSRPPTSSPSSQRKSPRSRPLAAYAAFVEYVNQVRFGVDPARGARAKTFISRHPAEATEVRTSPPRRPRRRAAAGDWATAKQRSIAATAKEPKDGIQHDLAILRGEIALAEKDTAGALAAFTDAAKIGAERTHVLRSRARALRREGVPEGEGGGRRHAQGVADPCGGAHAARAAHVGAPARRRRRAEGPRASSSTRRRARPRAPTRSRARSRRRAGSCSRAIARARRARRSTRR